MNDKLTGIVFIVFGIITLAGGLLFMSALWAMGSAVTLGNFGQAIGFMLAIGWTWIIIVSLTGLFLVYEGVQHVKNK